MSITTKTSRIDLRVSSKDKDLLDQAAEAKSLSLSSYIISVAVSRAKMDVAENERIVLASQDRDLILSALSAPDEPNKALKGLFDK